MNKADKIYIAGHSGMVGSAIFVFPGTTGQLAGPGANLAWILEGLLMLTIALW